MRTIAAVPASALLAGAALGLLLSNPPYILTSISVAASVAAAIVAFARRRPVLLVVAVICGFLSGGTLLSSVAWQRAWRPSLRVVFERLARAERAQAEHEGRRVPEDDEAFAIVEGVLRADASLSDGGVSLSVAVDGLEGRDGITTAVARAFQASDAARLKASPYNERHATGGITVTVVGGLAADRIDDWRAGRRVRFPVQLRRPARYLDPGVPDHERALARRGIALVGTVKSGALVEVLARGSPLDEAMASTRAYVRRAIAAAVGQWSRESAGIVTAIVIGDRAGLAPALQQQLQDAGTYHVIAISGGNIAIVAGLLLGAFRIAGWLGRTAMLIAIVALAGYALLVGGGASVDRATFMAAIYFAARALDHRSAPFNVLALAAGVLVATDPPSIADPAFLLTFGATLAILLVFPATVTRTAALVEQARTRIAAPPKVISVVAILIRAAAAMFAASVAAEAMLFPVGAIAFSRITFAGLVLNFIAIPLMAVAQVAGMAVVPLAEVSQAAALAIGFVAHLGASGLARSAALVEYVPLLAYRVAPPPWPVVALYYGASAAAWASWPRARRTGRAFVAVGAFAALWILVDPHTLVAPHGDGRLHVTFIDVGQGDATFVRFPHGSTLLVDAGGLSFSSSFDIGDRVVAPVVRDEGFRRIDYVALTHGDPDHIGGAAAIIAEFRPREVWEGIPVPRADTLTKLRIQTQSQRARWANVYAGARVAVDDVEVIARHPHPADWERQNVRNDDSLVLELRWRDVSVLLTGDIGRAVERSIAAVLAPAPLRIVKVPHHGSLSSSTPEFVNAIHPTVAVVSAGRANHFGHPTPEVMARYRQAGAAIFRTDWDGAVTVDSDGYSLEVTTFVGRRQTLH